MITTKTATDVIENVHNFLMPCMILIYLIPPTEVPSIYFIQPANIEHIYSERDMKRLLPYVCLHRTLHKQKSEDRWRDNGNINEKPSTHWHRSRRSRMMPMDANHYLRRLLLRAVHPGPKKGGTISSCGTSITHSPQRPVPQTRTKTPPCLWRGWPRPHLSVNRIGRGLSPSIQTRVRW